MLTPTEALDYRIKDFYRYLFNARYTDCLTMIDPFIRKKGLDAEIYCENLRNFRASLSPQMSIQRINFTLHIEEPNLEYQNRSFATGVTTIVPTIHLADPVGYEINLVERWVAQDTQWYTRCCGFLPCTPGFYQEV